ncbi:hypothetical protein BY996DRAFT_6521747 [Phakopsora pachyrhizi]|nr:hypothetical protein BY996DRAFT_6521747 [Phakopsora pachyrhizi]
MNKVLDGSYQYVTGLPEFSATIFKNHPPEAFFSAFTFTSSKFENTPHVDNDSFHVTTGWLIHVNKVTGE